MHNPCPTEHVLQASIETYNLITRKTIDRITNSGGEFIIYGASKLGWFVRAVLTHHNLAAKFFVDGKASREFNSFHGTKVISRTECFSLNKNLPVIVAIFNSKVEQKVKEELRDEGLDVIDVDPYALLYTFFTEVASRSCDKEEFARSIANLKQLYSIGHYTYGQISDKLFVSPFVVGNVTQKCNLKCIDCGQYIPYYEDPKTFSVDQLVDEIKNYCESFDLVPEVSLHGGEPFLHPEIGQICQKLAEIPNLIFINLITNGTLYPKPESWNFFKNAGVDIHQSDYRRISKRQAPIFDLCEEHLIYCDINWTNEHEMWWRAPPLEDQKRTEDENDKIFQKCVKTDICAQIMDGKLYRCPVAAHNFGKYPNISGKDFVCLTGQKDDGSRRAEVRAYITRLSCLDACRHCNPFEAKLVTPALQLSPKNKAIIDAGGEIL